MRVGCVKYLNARPLIHGWDGPVTRASPAELCAQLAGGDLDVALVSSFEFLRNPIYRIVDDVSISSNGPVYSVVVAHDEPISSVDEIALDPASETSVNLLRCLLAMQKLKPRLVAKSADEHGARLLIGDQAIRFRHKHPEFQFWDLGEAWSQLFDLPFVYALWLIRPEVPQPEGIANHLRALRTTNLNKISDVIAAVKDFDSAFCARYYRDFLRFRFGENEKQGLRAFHQLCTEQGLLSPGKLDLVAV